MRPGIIPAPIARQPWGVILPLIALVLFGSAVLYSAAGGNLRPWALTHVMRFGVFLVMALLITRLPRDLFKLSAYPVYGILVVLLVLVDLIGGIGGGSQRWLNLGFMTLQPSELMKPGIVLAFARFYADLPPALTPNWRSLLPAAGLLSVPAALVMIQPDLGTGLAITFGAVAVMFMAGLPLRWFIGAGVAGAIAAPIAFFTLLHDYQRNRVLVFLDPESDPLGTGYHITQSKIAIGSGGLLGKGFGQGSQSHLDYLPEAHTDFVFATMAEEWGLLGGLFVLIVFALILRWGFTTARNAPDRFSGLLAGGMTCTVFFYIAINLMMVMGLAPVVGIPLPFMSHGGSSMMTNMICLGTIMAVDRWSRKGGLQGS
ncbi:MAG TPA: rod shape-determining protein RodA [Novosphingobium sp.]|jgi:rod shape determining protein RodA|nr:rod shape-determining protein RodA [Novosphingobium sp.]HOA50516.1 rod shape-determining protein RodA [Novosphingobium sp.]HPB22155.1 rod shape-determining protein RodA [Novosphingobium sp.]HPZ47713.1 rod shape-determining protein RodA [Novosphingobium sp.]HQE00229.1 rod shape-determining protein RodA [Novosphingobium sp.]